MSRRSKRRKVSSTEEKKEQQVEKEFVYHERELRLEVLSVCPPNNFYITCYGYGWNKKNVAEWKSFSDDEKIHKVLKGCKDRVKDDYHPLALSFRKVQFTTIKRVYKTFVNPGHKGKLTRDTAMWEIIYKFLGEQTPLESRENETNNLSEVDNLDDMLRFITISGKTISKELLDHIFSFLERNYEIITKVGAVNKHFYLSLLSTWSEVVVNKQNINNISLLILKSTTSVRIPSTRKLLLRDFEYLWSKLSSSRFRKLSYELCDTQNSRNVLKSIRKYHQKCTNDEDYLFKNVTHLEILHPYSYRVSDLWDFQDEVLFPNLVSLKGIHSGKGSKFWYLNKDNDKRKEEDMFFLSDETSIRELGFHELPPENYLPDPKLEYEGFERITKLSISNIQCLGNTCYDHVLKRFNRLKRLELGLVTEHRLSYYSLGTASFDLGYFFSKESHDCLSSLTIRIGRKYHYNLDSFLPSPGNEVIYPPLDFNFDNRPLKNLEIYMDENIPSNEELFDFNLSELLSKTKMLNALESFKCRLPLTSRETKSRWLMKDYLRHVVPVIHIRFFEEFIFSTMIDEYKECDLTVTTGPENEEYLRIRYDRSYRRMRINYQFGYDTLDLPKVIDLYSIVNEGGAVDEIIRNLETGKGLGKIMMTLFLDAFRKKVIGGDEGSLGTIEFLTVDDRKWNDWFLKELEGVSRSSSGRFQFDGISSFFRK